MEIGKNYLIHCGDWHTFVGRVVDRIGPLMFKLALVSKIQETNAGDNWHILAAGEDLQARAACSYVHSTTPAIVPLAIIAFEWAGTLPQESGY